MDKEEPKILHGLCVCVSDSEVFLLKISGVTQA